MKLPNSKTYTGKFLGFEPDKGDTLVYRVLPDYYSKGQSSHYLVRSIVEPDNRPNHRTGLMWTLPPNIEPFDVPPVSPQRSPRFQTPDPPASLRHSTRITPDEDADPTLKFRQEHLTGDTPHVDDPEWDFMDKMEFLDPWNLEEDPWAIAKIKSY